MHDFAQANIVDKMDKYLSGKGRYNNILRSAAKSGSKEIFEAVLGMLKEDKVGPSIPYI